MLRNIKKVPVDFAIVLSFFILYIITLAPFIFWRDSPEFMDVGWTLGIAHPAGFPTYSLLAKLFYYLVPFGNIPFRANLFSAVCSVLVIYLFMKTSVLILRNYRGREPGPIDRFCAYVPAILMGVGLYFWRTSLSAEVYSLNLLFISLVIYLLLLGVDKKDIRYIYLGSFVYGLGSGNHATIAFLLPGLLIYFFWNWKIEKIKHFVLLIFFFLLGLSVYLYLPVRSTTNPSMDWCDPENWRQFLYLITDRKDAGFAERITTGGGVGFWNAVARQVRLMPPQYTFIGIIIAVVGLMVNIRMSPPLFLLLVTIFGLHGLFFIYWPLSNIHVQLFYAMALWMSLGLAWLVKLRSGSLLVSIRGEKVVVPVMLAVVALKLIFNYPLANQSRLGRVERTFLAHYESMAPNSLALVTVLWFLYRSYQDVMRLREDVTVIGTGDFVVPAYFNRVTKERFPRIAVPLWKYDEQTGYTFLYELLAMNLDQKRQIYWEIQNSMNRNFYKQVLPHEGFIFKFTFRPVEKLDEKVVGSYIDSLKRMILGDIDRGLLLEDEEAAHYYIWFLDAVANYFYLHGRPATALNILNITEEVFGPKGTNTMDEKEKRMIASHKAVYYIKMGRLQEARTVLESIVRRYIGCYTDYVNLGSVYLVMGRLDEAEYWIKKGMPGADPKGVPYVLLGDLYQKRGDLRSALKMYKKALAAGVEDEIRPQVEEKIEEISKKNPAAARPLRPRP